jgi:hypothetical protein
MTSPETPVLSVIVIALTGGRDLARCLEALRSQKNPPPLEVIVPRDDRFREGEFRTLRHPALRIVEVHGSRSFAELRTAGILASRGQIVAITEDQCIPPEGWCANILSLHSQGHAGVGGSVEKQEPDSPLGWAIYFRELGTYMPPVPEGPSATLTDCNVSYKRTALDRVASVWAKEFHEPQVHEALRQSGETLWLSPALLTYQQRTHAFFPALRERYEFGRLFGSLRSAEANKAKRFAWAAGSLVLPAVLLGRVIFSVLRKRRHLSACLLALPYIGLFAGIWSWGELVGYLTGKPGTKQ